VLKDYPPSKQPVWRLAVAEALAGVAAGVLFPFGLKSSTQRTARVREQHTIVLVHGYLANRSTLLPLALYLRWRGFKQILAFNYQSSQGIEQGALALRDFLRRHVRGGRIDLVCHSLGGLVARVYLQELGGVRRVDRCVTLGTPHQGTYNSYWVPSRVCGELRPDSALLARLRGSEAVAERIRFLSVVAGADNLVIPRVFAQHQHDVHVPDLGHLGLLFSPRVFRLVAEFLLEPRGQTSDADVPPGRES